jgi:hypothetical protein
VNSVVRRRQPNFSLLPVPVSSRISWRSRLPPVSASTSFSERASICSRSAARTVRGCRFRHEPAGGGRFHRREYVFHTRSDRGHVAAGGDAGIGFDVRNDVSDSARARGTGGAPASRPRRRERASGTPFISFFAPPEVLAIAREAGFKYAQYVSAAVLARRYFARSTDGLRPGIAEGLLFVAIT